MDENDVDYHHFWHMNHWNKPMGGGDLRTPIDKLQVISPTNIIKYQKADWLDGLRERKLPSSLLQWPLARIDEFA